MLYERLDGGWPEHLSREAEETLRELIEQARGRRGENEWTYRALLERELYDEEVEVRLTKQVMAHSIAYVLHMKTYLNRHWLFNMAVQRFF